MGRGIDLTLIKRFYKHADGGAFVDRILTNGEKELFFSFKSADRRAEFLAGIFAAKEAGAKALAKGLGPLSFKDMEIYKDKAGAPHMRLSQKAAMFLKDPENDKIEISITHEGEYAMSIAELKENFYPGNDLDPYNYHMNEELNQSLLKRDRLGYKSQYGRLIVIGGSEGMLGSVCLASRAALRSGAGLVHMIVPKGLADMAQIKVDEIMVKGAGKDDLRFFTPACLDDCQDLLEKADALVLGPGLGRRDESRDFVFKLLKQVKGKLLIDADGLNALAHFPDQIKNLSQTPVLTPHEMEMSRLAGLDLDKLRKNRIGTATDFSEKYGAITVLKGADTIITNGSLHYINATGNPGMATAGSGDVLSGMIGALLAYGYPTMIAARLGCYLHGLAGDIVRRRIGEEGLIASDIIGAIPWAFKLINLKSSIQREEDYAESKSR